MPHHCCVPLCKNNSKRTQGVSYHAFPLAEDDHELNKAWRVAVRRDAPFTINKWTRVCGEHFTEDDFMPGDRSKKVEGGRKNRKLAPGAIPSVFKSFPSHLQTPAKKRKAPADRHQPTEKRMKSSACAEATSSSDLDLESSDDEPELGVHEHCSCVADLQQEVELLKTQQPRLSVKHFSSDEKIHYYTGFPTFKRFQSCYNYLQPAAEKMRYWRGGKTVDGEWSGVRKGPGMKLPLIDQFFMVMMRLRLGLDTEDLGDRFQVSANTISRTFISWINLMYVEFQALPMWPSRRKVNRHMPPSFKKWYPSTRVIIDGTEFFMEKPSSLERQSATWSSYKNHNTLKSLIGITPDGTISFVSDLYEGSISDRELTEVSGLLQQLEPGDSVMADKGFNVQDLLAAVGVRLNMPPKRIGERQMAPEDVMKTKKIAAVRIHVERAIRRVKLFRILSHVIPNSLAGVADQMVFVVCMLCNFQPGLAA